MRNHALKLATLLTASLALAFFLPQRAAADDDDPPSRIARLSHIDGEISFDPAGTDDWVSAVVNRPITTGDKLWADRDSRAELQLGSATIRIGSMTGFSFLNLSDWATQLQLTEGSIRIRVRRLGENENFEVDTPNLAFSILRPGIYRISVNEGGDSTVIHVRGGEGEVTGGGQAYTVHGEETGTFTGTDQLNADIEGIGSDDDLEAWSEERDRRQDHSISSRYVSDEAVGYEDLDDYGGWRNTEYGEVWFPHTTIVGWAPYRYGHWAYIYPWGYTWVEDEPWGFAPFHYGRWVVVGGVWGWVPCRPAVVGVAYVRPVYAPALVAWVGGPHFAIGVSVGGAAAVGWFPLGPREVYVPSYPVSRTYVNQVNITNTTVNTTVVNNYYNNVVVNKNVTVTNVKYVNQSVPGAVTATSTQVMTSGQSVHNNVVRVDEREIARAPVAAATPAVPPTRQAVIGAGRPASVKPPVQVVNRAVVAKTTPPPPPPKVDRTIAAVQQNGGRPIPISQARQISQQEQAKPPVRVAPPARPATPQNAGNRPGQQPQNANRPQQENVQSNRPNQPSQPATVPNNRPNNVPANENRPPNEQANPNRPPNAQPNNNRPPNARTDRPPSAQPASPPRESNPNLERQHQQELENMHKQQDQERQRVEQQQQQERQRLNQQRADDQRRQQVQQQQQRQLEDQQRKQQEQQRQVEQRQQQEHQQERQQERAQPRQDRPPQQRQEQPRQQEKPKQSEKPKDKEKPPKS
jgi:uncharacterized protein DUF6600